MTEWTEDWVRGAAGWKPFKEGKAMQAAGQVSGFTQRENICQGLFKEGRTTLRTTVKVIGPTDVRVQCGCIENRATGAICAHAVAVLLNAVAPKKDKSAVQPSVQKSKSAITPATSPSRREPAPKPLVPVAWEIRLSPRYREELAGGRLSLRLMEISGEPTPEDIRLSAWLGPAVRKCHTATLSGKDLADFLDLAVGHPRVIREGGKSPLVIQADPYPPLALDDSRRQGETIIFTTRALPRDPTLFVWGDSPALAFDHELTKLPVSASGANWLAQAGVLIRQGEVRAPLKDILADYDHWTDLFESPPAGWLGTLKLAGEEPRFSLELDGSRSAMTARLKVEYPGCEVIPLPPRDVRIPGLPKLTGEDMLTVRLFQSEAEAVRKLRILGFEQKDDPSRFELRDEDLLMAFLSDGMRQLSVNWQIRRSESLNRSLQGLKVVRPVIQQRGEGVSLGFELSFQTNDGTHIPSSEIRRLLGASRGRNPLKDRSALILSKDCDELVGPLISDFGIGRPDQAFLLKGPEAVAFKHAREYLQNRQISNHSNLEDIILKSENLTASLRSYQTLGAKWLVKRLEDFKGALLADEMGLGKTIQSIASISHFNQKATVKSPALILAPTSLIGNWSAEIKRFAPNLSLVVLHGSQRDKWRDKVDGADVVLTSYGTLVRDLAFHLGRSYSLVVADEASVLKNQTTDISKSVYKLQAEARLALTGTPVENRLRDLWSIFRFVAPGYLGTLSDFEERYAVTDGASSSSVLQRLRLRISPFVLRRTKAEVAKDLPEKIEIDEWLEMEPDQAKLYAGIAKAGLAEIDRLRDKQGDSAAGKMHLLTLLLRLRQICVDPALLRHSESAQDPSAKRSIESSVKIDRLEELLSELSNESKALVFSQFSLNLRNIKERLGNRFGTVFLLDGSTRNRAELVQQFQEIQGPAVFLISIKAGGYGLNLTAADTVIHMDPWWNPATEAQATDRAHRIGQTKPVTVYRLLTKETVEERVRRMQDHKRAIIAATTGEEGAPSNWTAEDLDGLLR